MEFLDLYDNKTYKETLDSLEYCSGLLSELEADKERLSNKQTNVLELESKYAGLLNNSSVEEFREITYDFYNPGVLSIKSVESYSAGLLFIGKMFKKIWEFIKTIFKKIVNFFKRWIGGKSETEIDMASLKGMVNSLEKLGFKHKKISEIWDGKDLVKIGNASLDICFGGVNGSNGICLLDFVSNSIDAANGIINAFELIKDTGTYRENTGLLKGVQIAQGLSFDVNNGQVESKGFDELASKAFSEASKRVGAQLNHRSLPSNIKKISDGILKYAKDSGKAWIDFDKKAGYISHRVHDVLSVPAQFANDIHFAIRERKLKLDGSKGDNKLGVSLEYNGAGDVIIELKEGDTNVYNTAKGKIDVGALSNDIMNAFNSYGDNNENVVFISGSISGLRVAEVIVIGAEFGDGGVKIKAHSPQTVPMSQPLPILYKVIDSSKKRIYLLGTSLFYGVVHREADMRSSEEIPGLVKRLVGDMTIGDIGKLILEYGGEAEAYNKYLKSAVQKMENIEKRIAKVDPIKEDDHYDLTVGTCLMTIVRRYTEQMGDLCKVVAKIDFSVSNEAIRLLGDSIVSYCKKNNIDVSKDDQGKIKVLSYN